MPTHPPSFRGFSLGFTLADDYGKAPFLILVPLAGLARVIFAEGLELLAAR